LIVGSQLDVKTLKVVGVGTLDARVVLTHRRRPFLNKATYHYRSELSWRMRFLGNLDTAAGDRSRDTARQSVNLCVENYRNTRTVSRTNRLVAIKAAPFRNPNSIDGWIAAHDS
jgi:hypothetical protein